MCRTTSCRYFASPVKNFAMDTAPASGVPMVFAPVEKGRLLGQVKLYLDGVEVEALPLAAARDVEARPVTRREGGESFWRRFFRWIGFG